MSTLQPWEDYSVKDTWITSLYTAGKITAEVARRCYVRTVSRAQANVQQLEFVESEKQKGLLMSRVMENEIRLRGSLKACLGRLSPGGRTAEETLAIMCREEPSASPTLVLARAKSLPPRLLASIASRTAFCLSACFCMHVFGLCCTAVGFARHRGAAHSVGTGRACTSRGVAWADGACRGQLGGMATVSELHDHVAH